MPRQARLDAPGTLHHVILRGLERGRIVADDQDRVAFVERLGTVATATGTPVYAWALLPNHAHLLLRSGPGGLPQVMRRLLTGYAGAYNRRHRRHGHLFQNRYKSIVCEEDAYFRELVRYLHLNPLRAGLVADLRALDRYPWCGHRWLLAAACPAWYARREVLAWFGPSEAAARPAYRAFLRAGAPHGRRPELVGGGLVRSLGGWAEVRAVRQRGAATLADPRILGTGPFVEQLLAAAPARPWPAPARARRLAAADRLVRERCAAAQVGVAELRAGSRRRPVVAVRGALVRHLVTRLGLSLADAARQLGVSTSGIAKALDRIDRARPRARPAASDQ
jgi:REP element-mobilizing transposase RayT